MKDLPLSNEAELDAASEQARFWRTKLRRWSWYGLVLMTGFVASAVSQQGMLILAAVVLLWAWSGVGAYYRYRYDQAWAVLEREAWRGMFDIRRKLAAARSESEDEE